MDLIDRYLAAISRRLPAARAADLTAEIRDDLLSRVEAREEALDRPLYTQEVSALIKDMGHPLIVASRYREHQFVIGPNTYPFFEFSLRIALMLVAAWIIVSAVAAVTFGHQPAMRAVGHAIGGAWSGAFSAVGIVTVVFYVLERAGFPNDQLLKWTPDELPSVTEKRKNSWEAALEAAIGVAAILWWVGAIHIPIYSSIGDLRIEPAPIWTTLYTPILALLIAQLAITLSNWLLPRWRVARSALIIGTTAAALVLLSLLYDAGHWVTIVAPGVPANELPNFLRHIDLGIRVSIVVAGVIWVVQCVQELWRMWGRRAVTV